MHERVGGGEAELFGDRVLLLQREAVRTRAGDALQRHPDVQEQLAPGLDAGEVGPGQETDVEQRRASAGRSERPTAPVERLHVAQTTRTLLQVGFQHLRDRARAEPAEIDRVRDHRQDLRPAPRRELPGLAFQLDRELGRPRDQPHVEQRGRRVEVLGRECDRLLDRARAVTGHEPGIPERIPELLGHLLHGVGTATAPQVVDQQHVDIRTGTQLTAAVRPERDERDLTRPREIGEGLAQRRVDGVGECGTERASS